MNTGMKTIAGWLYRLRFSACLVLGLAAVVGLGARCIERTNVHVDKDGYTHITGEMVNETNIQGTRIMLRGTLFDDQDNVVAQKEAPTCPPDTQPNSETVFDIRFDNPVVAPFARFDVRPISGVTLASPLTDPDVVLFSADAIRFDGLPPIPGLGITDNDVFFKFNVRNRSGFNLDGVQGCAAVYDQKGNVIAATSDEIIQLNASGVPRPASLGSTAPGTVFMLAKGVSKGPTQVRAWLWFGQKGAATSQYQFVSTPFITIQTRHVP